MRKHQNISCIIAFFILFSFTNGDSQTNNKYTIGATLNGGNHEVDFSLNFGLFYKKNYSQLNLLNNLGVSAPSFEFWQKDPNLLKHSGIGFTQRYYPNKTHSLFAGFLQGEALFIKYSAATLFNDSLDLNSKSFSRNIAGIYFGYGISLNVFHHFTLLSSIDYGGCFISGKDYYNYTTHQSVNDYSEWFRGYQFKWSFIYCINRF